MNHLSSETLNHLLIFNSSDSDNDENGDFATFQFESRSINLNYSLLTKYSKHIRDEYVFSDITKRLPLELHSYQEQYNIHADNIFLFFQLLQQNLEINENLSLTYEQCDDLFKISVCFQIEKLSKQLKKYFKKHNVDVNFLIQIILYEEEAMKKSENYKFQISEEMESVLTTKIDECLLNEKFAELPISIIFRITELGSIMKKITANNLFDFIKKSTEKFGVLFQFLELKQLSDDRLEELFELYSNSDESNRLTFGYMKCNLDMIKELNDQLKNLMKQLNNFEEAKAQSEGEMKKKLIESENEKISLSKKLELKIDQLEKQLAELENDKQKLEDEKIMMQKQIKNSEDANKELQKRLEEEMAPAKGQITASIKSGLLINANIKLVLKGSLDTSRSKYIISSSDSKTVGVEAYKKGESITSSQMSTIDFICRPGTYYVRCIVFNSEGKSVEIVSNPVVTSGNNVLFGYEGKPTKVSLFKGKYKLEVWGAKGGDSQKQIKNSPSPGKGGLGGYSRGFLTLNENETFYIFVGGEGRSLNSSGGSITSGGFPDGGGTEMVLYDKFTPVPGTGGGSTSIRIGSDSDYARVIVAGGGGGSSGNRSYTNHGGFGGGLSGGNCYFRSSITDQGAGTQTGSTGGLGHGPHGDPGRFGHGADGKYSSGRDSGGGGGGGGGWYGGGSGGQGGFTDDSSGGGGSGWTFTESDFNTWKSGDSTNSSKFILKKSFHLTDALTIAGDKEFPKPDGKGNEQGHSGNGYAKITPE